MSLGLLQAGLGDHCLELIPGAHVDGLRNQLAFTVVNEAFGDSFHLEKIVYLSAGVEQHGIGNFLFRDEGLNFCGLLIGNGNDYESLIFVPVVERFANAPANFSLLGTIGSWRIWRASSFVVRARTVSSSFRSPLI